MTFKDKGIVLKEIFVGESDKIITVLFAEHGKMSISAKGARKPKSKYASATQPFCYSEFVIYTGTSIYTVTQAEVLQNFYALRNEYESFCYGSFFLEMADKLIYPEMPSCDTVTLLIAALKTLATNKISPKLSAAIFQMKFMQMEGYAPEMDVCAICGSSGFEALYFCSEGLLCQNCTRETKEYLKFTETASYAVNYILTSEISKLFAFTLAETDLSALINAVTLFRRRHIEVSFKSLDLIF